MEVDRGENCESLACGSSEGGRLEWGKAEERGHLQLHATNSTTNPAAPTWTPTALQVQLCAAWIEVGDAAITTHWFGARASAQQADR